jgi:hypothetical protein
MMVLILAGIGAQRHTMVRDFSPSSRSVCTSEPGGSLSISGEGSCVNFDRVLVSDNNWENIISVSSLADRGIHSLFKKDGVEFLSSDTGMVVATGSRVRGLYRIPLEDVFSQEAVSTSAALSLMLILSFYSIRGPEILLQISCVNRWGLNWSRGWPCPDLVLPRKVALSFSAWVTLVPTPR